MKKRTFSIFVCLLTSILVSACASNVETVEVTRIVQQISITNQSVIPNKTPYPPPYPPPFLYLPNPYYMTPTPLRASIFTQTPFIKSLQGSPTLTSQQVVDKIAACYHVEPECSACKSKLNNSVLHVIRTTRMFINVPKDLYPKELFRYAMTIKGNATMGWISNGGLPGLAFDGSSECWSTYVEFGGHGEIDLKIPSILIGVPDYYVRFIVDLDRTP